jgi:hypothetical protein
MALRFPRGSKVTITPKALNGLAGHEFRVDLDGDPISYGWTGGTKSEARREAWNACEAQGLVTDGVDS